MTQLPSSIEQYLQEAGFSPTELLVLKRLLEGSAMTLRELAAKTGKSTGVLDQATKKLIDKRIVTKEAVNDTQKYAISSLEAIQRWVEKDMIDRHTELKRKKENFDAFLATVAHRKDRPEIESFEGEEGMKKAFKKLLAIDVPEWIHFAPAVMREADDPLAQFRVELFRERRGKKIFMRALTPDVPLGHRYQSRDVYEYRQTRFVPPDEFPVTFEQYIVGDTVACIDTVENKASFVHFPQLAESQKKLFGVMWGNARKTDDAIALPTEASNKAVPLKTALVSGLRECFLSKKSLLFMLFAALVSAAITMFVYQYVLQIIKNETGARLMSIAATTAVDFAEYDLNSLNKASDMSSRQYQQVFSRLNEVRELNDEIEYAYILRPHSKFGVFYFVADADSNYNLPSYIDYNENGIADNDEWNVAPGVSYYAGEQLISSIGLSEPVAEPDFISDQWGIHVTASAPIIKDGKTIAVLAFDTDVTDIYKTTRQAFAYPIWLALIFAVILLARFLFIVRSRFTND